MAEKPVHTLVLDAGPVIKNEPAVSSLLAQADALITTPAVIAEIRDRDTRQRVQTTWMPFLTLRSPNPNSVKILTEFARRTGDLAVLSRTDVQILALAYELECERNGGDWRLRSVPGQKRTNGPAPKPADVSGETGEHTTVVIDQSNQVIEPDGDQSSSEKAPLTAPSQIPQRENESADKIESAPPPALPEQLSETTITDSWIEEQKERPQDIEATTDSVAKLEIFEPQLQDIPIKPLSLEPTTELAEPSNDNPSSDSDSEGWITPSNLKKRQTKDANTSTLQTPEPKTMQVATITTDFAMQNVLLQMNLNLLSPSLQRVRHIKTHILRCHACFLLVRDTSKQFCPRCGKPTLTRVSCSTNQNGEFKIHLKKNMQWNHRGDRYSIPKPVAGTANGKLRDGGGGKGGWGQGLILAEDQKEYLRAVEKEKRTKERDLLDEDYLPGILTGERGNSGGRLKVGAGRTVNSRRQR